MEKNIVYLTTVYKVEKGDYKPKSSNFNVGIYSSFEQANEEGMRACKKLNPAEETDEYIFNIGIFNLEESKI